MAATDTPDLSPADRIEIDALLARYCFYLDDAEVDGLDAVFADDLTWDYEGFGAGRERESLTAMIRGDRRGLDGTHHSLGTRTVEPTARGARGRTYVTATHVRHAAQGGSLATVGGWYLDEFARTPDGWRIVSRTYRNVWLSGNPAVFTRDVADQPEAFAPARGVAEAMASRHPGVPAFAVVFRGTPPGRLGSLERALRDARDAIERQHRGVAVSVAIAESDGVDLLQDALGGPRGIAMRPLDGVIQVATTAYTAEPGDFAALVDLAAVIGRVPRPDDGGASIALAGYLNLVLPGSGPVWVGLGLRHGSGTTLDDMHHWWIASHAELVQRTNDPMPLGYHQLYAMPDLSRAVADAARVAGATDDLDIWTNIFVPTAQHYVEAVTNAATMDEVVDDERGNLDESSWCGAVMRVL